MIHLNTERASQAAENAGFIRSAVDASPNKVAIVVVSGAYDHPGWHASDLDPRGGDHVAVAYYDEKTQSYKLAEMVPSETLTDLGKAVAETTGSTSLGAALGSENKPGDIQKLAWDYKEVAAVPLDLDQAQASGFLSSVLDKTEAGNTYSFLSGRFLGETCASSIAKAIQEKIDPNFGHSNFPSLDGLTEYVQQTFKVELPLPSGAAFNDVLPSAILHFFADMNGVIYGSQSLVHSLFHDDSPHIGVDNGPAHSAGIGDIFGADSLDFAALPLSASPYAGDFGWHEWAVPSDQFALSPSFASVPDAGPEIAGHVLDGWFNVHPTEYLLV
jgi:hypothetical protein